MQYAIENHSLEVLLVDAANFKIYPKTNSRYEAPRVYASSASTEYNERVKVKVKVERIGSSLRSSMKSSAGRRTGLALEWCLHYRLSTFMT